MTQTSLLSALLVLAAGAAAVVVTTGKDDAPRQGTVATDLDATLADAPLEAWRAELLDVAFAAASALPLDPHVKNRSRLQEAAVAAAIELCQARRAWRAIPSIADWRRGACYADLAYHLVEKGAAASAPPLLALAAEVAAGAGDDETGQAWRQDRVRAKIARVWLRLGEPEKARRFASDLADSEVGTVEAALAAEADAAAFDAQVESADRVLAAGSFDQAKNALETCARLFDRFYGDAPRRLRAEERVRTAYAKLPVMVRIGLLHDLAGAALRHDDRAKALELADAARQFVEDHRWLPEDRIPMLAKIAALRFRAGDVEAAREEADAALAAFEAERPRIADIYRAGALRPLAETYAAMGDAAAAISVYRIAVEAGAENPNGRPRADDLVATCCSMARHGVRPDAGLWDRIRRIHGGLAPPW